MSGCVNTFDNDILKCQGFLKSRMWSQYGENHEGVCLVFSKDAIQRELNTLEPKDKYFVYSSDMQYTEYFNNDSPHNLV